MAPYEPAWRRPIASGFRRTADGAVRWCVRHHIHPNTVSYMSMAAAAAAGTCFLGAGRWPLLLIPAALFCDLRLWFNMLDGMVAIASKRASRTGEIANELPDRISDVIILVGAGMSGLCDPVGGYWAAILALLTAYVGTLGQAVGARREFGGIMSKPWRMVVLHIGAWITLALLLWNDGRIRFGGFTVLDWTFAIIIVGCVQTVIVRLSRIVRTLRALE